MPCVIVDLEHGAVSPALEHGTPAVWGDIASEDILRAAGVPVARMLVMAIPSSHAVRLGRERAKRLDSRLFVVARATGAADVIDLRQCGVHAVVQPEFEGGLEMVRRAPVERSDDEIDSVIGGLRRGFYGVGDRDS